MTVKELIDKLSEFDSDLEIEFEFEEYCEDGWTWLLRFDKLMKLAYDKDTLLFLLKNRNK
jgi:hypothetical protein